MRRGVLRPSPKRWLAARLIAAVAVSLALSALTVPANAARPRPSPTPLPSPSPSSTSTFIKAYANILNNIEYGLTPEDVHTTSDGGYIVLASTGSSDGVLVSWLLKLDSSGNPRWQKEIGCLSGAPGDNAVALSVQQTADGGYILAGGTIGCGSGSGCPELSGIQCALVDKLDSAGNPVWAYTYPAGFTSSVINQVKQTRDGGYIAVGSATDANQAISALVLKLGGQGSVQWQRKLGPAVSTQSYLNAVQQTSDDGYVATGEFYTPQEGPPLTSILVVNLDSSGNLRWQRGFNDLDSTGAPTASEKAKSIVQTQDGGYLVVGGWFNSTFAGQGAVGALLLKLDASGAILWQNAYSGGVYCSFNGCSDIGALVYSVLQTADGGYLLAGSGDLKLIDEVPIEPWLAKVDARGGLLWQHLYYQINPSTGRPLGEYFASSALGTDGGPMAAGWTENYALQKGELYGVKTDGSGGVGTSCSEVHPASALSAINPALTDIAPSLPVQTTLTTPSKSPGSTLATSVAARANC
jgi:hypothetical protein